MQRRGGIRVAFVLAAIGVYFGTLAVLALAPALEQQPVLDTAQWLVMAIGTAIVGDTVRPSGVASSILSPAPTPPAG